MNATTELCEFYWDSYFKVDFVGSCNFTKLSDYKQTINLPRFCTSISLSILGALFNLWALVLIILDLRLPKTVKNPKTSSENSYQTNQYQSKQKRSTMHIGLIVFCFFEVFYHISHVSGELIRYHAISYLNNNQFNPPIDGELAFEIGKLPLVASVFDWSRDVGICSRSWAITLITITRAEVVLWPLGSRFYQRCFRKKRTFFCIFLLVLLIATALAGFRRIDQKLAVCYNEILSAYCGRTMFFLVDLVHLSFIYFSFQILVPWLLILIFTVIIIALLKPCERSNENSSYQKQKTNGGLSSVSRHNHVHASVVVLVLAIFFTVFEFPTFALCMYYLTGNPNTDLYAWDVASVTLMQLDSIANFFLLIVTMPTLKHRLIRQFRFKETSLANSYCISSKVAETYFD